AFTAATAGAPGSITIGGVTFPIAIGTTLTGQGLIAVGANLCLAATLDVTGQIILPSSITASVNTTINICGVVTAFTAATAGAPGSITIGGTTFPIAAGTTLAGQGLITVGANLCLAATLNVTGQIIVPSSVTVGVGMTLNICGVVTAFTAATAGAPGSITIGGVTFPIAAGTTLAGQGLITVGANLCLGATLNVTGQIILPSTVTVNANVGTTLCGTVTAFTAATATTPGSITVGGVTLVIAPGTTIGGGPIIIGTTICITITLNPFGQIIVGSVAPVVIGSPVGPGSPFPTTSEVSDQKAGSVLVYNLYSSGSTNSNTQNTRINITNTNQSFPIAVHLFFVDGTSCSIADANICLTANQTTSFLASDIDPGTTGYIVAIASDTATGCPANFNFLIGDEYVKLATGHAANLGAEAFAAALAGGLAPCDANSVTAVLAFDGIAYNRVPRVLAVDNVASRADGNDTLLVINRFGGNLATGAATLINLFGIFYDDSESALSFGFGGPSSSPGTCQFRGSLTNSFPRLTPRFDQFIPAGRSGWAKIFSQADIGLLGAVLNANPNAGTNAGAFEQGHNLHKLTLTSTVTLTIPIFPPNC
ncbi:MAG: hypothetical protein ABI977_02925, partial [Acidobacteriota bacterium]